MRNQVLTALCAVLCPILVGASAVQAADYYVDPEKGSAQNSGAEASPWRSLQAAVDGGRLRPGDTLYLRDGFHGTLSIQNKRNDDWVTIAAAPGQKPRLDTVLITASRFWRLTGLEVSPSYGNQPLDGTIIEVLGQSSDIAIEDSFIHSAPGSSSWSVDEWRKRVLGGFYVEGQRITLRRNKLDTIYHAIETIADDAIVEGNLITNFAGDGIRGLGQNSVYENNRITSCVAIDDNHDDGFQSWSLDANGAPGFGDLAGGVFRGNVIIAALTPDQPLICELQGIGMFDGTFSNWVIENNVIATNHWHGITVMGARNVWVSNNTVASLGGGQVRPWISITYHKDGRPPAGSVIANNLAPPRARSGDDLFNLPKPGVQVFGNVTVDDPDDFYVDAAKFDFRLRKNSAAVNAGDERYAPATDIDGGKRPKGAGVDVGAYESW